MRHCFSIALLVVLLIPVVLSAQNAVNAQGIQWGRVYIQPEATVLGAYDNRALVDEVSGDPLSDFYTEVAGGFSIGNLPARYDLSANARYGYRFYSENVQLNDDFYNAGAAVSTDKNPFKWGLSANVTKALGYDTFYDPSSGDGPDSILTDEPNRLLVANGNMTYEKQLTENTSIIPGYNVLHYYQDFQGSGTAEWQIHNASVQLRQAYSAKTFLTLTGNYTLQVNDDEDGYVGLVELGVESSMTDKIVWRAAVGIAAADYELSGSDQSGILNLRATWLVTEKVSTYIFYGNGYEPGYGGGAARLVYRAGYGADWRFSRRWALGAAVLHDYQQELGSVDDSTYGGVQHFFSAQCSYDITTKLLLSLQGNYINDQAPVNQTIISINLGYAF